MSRKKTVLTLSVPPGTKEKLEAIAQKSNILWGKEPSVSGLIVAIAEQKLEIGQPFALSKSQVYILSKSIDVLIDTGNLGEAQVLAELLLERGNLEIPLRQSLMQKVSQLTTEAWRVLVDEKIKAQQPFRLLYGNAQAQELEYTVRYAEICFYEKRFYLQIWCEETEDIKGTDFPELIHNRCLRLERIKALVTASGEWRQAGLDYLEVCLHLRKGLVKAYEVKDRDISDEVIEVGKLRQIVRRVSNPFWLVREVLRYGQDCIVVSPENVRDRIKQELLASYQNYNPPSG